MNTLAKVHKVHPKKNGAHTVVLTTKRMNAVGMLIPGYFLAKMPKAPKKGAQLEVADLHIERTAGGFRWIGEE